MEKIDIAADKEDLRCLIKILFENGSLSQWEYAMAMDLLRYGE